MKNLTLFISCFLTIFSITMHAYEDRNPYQEDSHKIYEVGRRFAGGRLLAPK